MKLRALILAALLLVSAAPAFSQGCAMCYSTAAGASSEGQKAIRRGILILLVPPLGVMSLGVWMASRYAKKRDLQQVASSPDPARTHKRFGAFVARTTHKTIGRFTVQ